MSGNSGRPRGLTHFRRRLTNISISEFIAVCHCLDCKKASGGEAATWFGVPEDDFTLISGATKAYSYVADSENGSEFLRGMWRAFVHEQFGGLPGPCVRSIGKEQQ